MKTKKTSSYSSKSFNIAFSKSDSSKLNGFNFKTGDFVCAKVMQKLSNNLYLVNIKGKKVVASSDSYNFNENQNIFTEVKSFDDKLVLKLLPQDASNRDKYLFEQIQKQLIDINYPPSDLNVLVCKSLLLNNISLSVDTLNLLLKYGIYLSDDNDEQTLNLIIKLLSDEDGNLHSLDQENLFDNYILRYENNKNNDLTVKILFLFEKLGNFLTEFTIKEDPIIENASSQNINIDIKIFCCKFETYRKLKLLYDEIKTIVETDTLRLNKVEIVLIEKTMNTKIDNSQIYTHIDLKI